MYSKYYPSYRNVNCEQEEEVSYKEEEGTCRPTGKSKYPNDTAGNPIRILSGNNEEVETDIAFSTPHEKKFTIYRTYKSRKSTSTSMGYGWTHNYNVVLTLADPLRTDHYRIVDESGIYHLYQDMDGDGTYTGYISTKGILVHESDDTYTWSRPNGIIYIFNQNLQFIAKIDSNGNVQTLTYNIDNSLDTVTDQATGRSIGFVYNAEGYIDHITGPVTPGVPDGIYVNYQYDTQGNLTRVTYADDNNGSDASGFEYRYEDPYDVHNLTEKRNLADEVLSNWVYDSSDRAYENTTRDGKGAIITGFGTSSVVVTDAHGAQKTYTIERINGRNAIINVSSPSGCISCGADAVRYNYDDQHRVNEIEYANGRIDQYTDFDDQDRYHTELQAVDTPAQRTLFYDYHPETGDWLYIRETSLSGSGDKETIFDYDDDGNITPNESPTGLIHRRIERGVTQDASGTLTTYEYVTAYTYTAKGQVASVDGPLDGSQDLVTFTYDAITGDLLTQTLPLVGTTTFTYDAAGNVETVTDPNGIITTLTYDGRNRQLSANRNGITTSQTYTAAGEPDTATDALGRATTFAYNTAGLMEKIIDPSDNFIYYGYNSLGLHIEQSLYTAGNVQTLYHGIDYGDPAGNPDLFSGKPWKSLHPSYDDTASLETVYTYDASGNLNSVTDANGNVTAYVYDLFNRLSQVVQPGNVVTSYGYDTQGNLSVVTNAEGHVTSYTYDDLGRLVQKVSPDDGTTLYTYDAAGNLRYKIQNSRTTEYQYDVLGRMTGIIHTDATQNVTMTYDTGTGNNLMGRLASMNDPSGTVAYSYDVDGNLESETRTISGVTYITGYGYDAAGNLRTIVYPTGHSLTYEPDTMDPMLIGSVILDAAQPLATGITYKPFGPVSSMTLGNGITVSRGYDRNYQLISQTSSVLSRIYLPDNVGNIEAITDNLDPDRIQAFDYDELYRLTNAIGDHGVEAFTYDKVGNRLTRTKTNGVNESDIYNYYSGTNRLYTINGIHAELFEYDTDGNTIARTPGASNPNPPVNVTSDHIYNASGQRITKSADGQTTVYHYDLSGQLIAETDTAGNLIKAYVWLHSQPLAQIVADGSVYYYHTDHLGSPQKMTDGTGTLVWSADYLPFGRANVTVETIENNLRLPGQYYDSETGLHYNWHRYYDPETGRYLTPDPIGLAGGINPFLYAEANPINYIDPDGQFAFLIPAIAWGLEYTAGMALADLTIALTMGYSANQALQATQGNDNNQSYPNLGTGGSCPNGDDDDPNNKNDKLKNIYSSIKDSPNYPKGFKLRPGGMTANSVKNRQLLSKLREIESGKWHKVYKDGFDAYGNRVSIHYFKSQSGKAFDVWVKNGWSNF